MTIDNFTQIQINHLETIENCIHSLLAYMAVLEKRKVALSNLEITLTVKDKIGNVIETQNFTTKQ